MDFDAEELKELEGAAELLKVLAHPVRLCIVKGLAEKGECNVSHMQNCLSLPQSTISQHLGKLRAAGIIKGRRDGVEVYYSLVNPLAEQVIRAVSEFKTEEKKGR